MENNTERTAEEIVKEILDYSDHTSYRDKDHLLPSVIKAIESERAKTDKFMQELNTLRVQTVEKDAKIKALQNEVDTLLQGHAGDKGAMKDLYNQLLGIKGIHLAQINEHRDKIKALEDENEKLHNRVNLLSVSANTIRDAYDNGLNAELQSTISKQAEEIVLLKNKLVDQEIENEFLSTKIYKEAVEEGIHNKLNDLEVKTREQSEEITCLLREVSYLRSKGLENIDKSEKMLHETEELAKKRVETYEKAIAHLTSLVEKKDYALDKVIGFCVAFREDQPCWESHQDVGILFATARVARDITLPPIPEKGS